VLGGLTMHHPDANFL